MTMKRTFLTIAFGLLTVTAAFAQKFAFVDTEYLMKNIPAYESAAQQLEQKMAKGNRRA